MLFVGISRAFSLLAEGQYNTIGAFWDEMSELYGMENLHGLGYKWENGKIYYAIGLKDAEIEHSNFRVELPDDKWETVEGNYVSIAEFFYVELHIGNDGHLIGVLVLKLGHDSTDDIEVVSFSYFFSATIARSIILDLAGKLRFNNACSADDLA